MTIPPNDDTVHGNAIEALQQELAATNVLLIGLGRELASDRVETAVRVEGLRAEQHRERRVRMMYVAGIGLTVVYAYDLQVGQCSPGARVTHGIDYLLKNPPKPTDTPESRQSSFQQVYDSAPWYCDVSMPLHTHDGGHFPHVGNWAGGAFVGILALGTALYHRWRTRRDFARVLEAAEAEERHQGVIKEAT